MENLETISRRRLIKIGGGVLVSTVLAGCEPFIDRFLAGGYSPEDYTIEVPRERGLDRYEAIIRAFEGVDPIQLSRLQPSIALYDDRGNYIPSWTRTMNSAEVNITGGWSGSRVIKGSLTILTDRDYGTQYEGRQKGFFDTRHWRGFLASEDPTARQKHEFEIGVITVERAEQVINDLMQPVRPEYRDNTAIKIFFSDSSKNYQLLDLVKNARTVLALMQFNRNNQAIRDSRLLFQI